jgi:hypothetical protein
MHSVRDRAIALLLAATVVTLAVSSLASADTKKQYTVALTPNPAPGGATQLHVSATFNNLSASNQSIGSAQLTAPSGFTVVGSTTPGSSV